MCQVIYANDDTIETMGELADMIGGQERIVFNPGYTYKAKPTNFSATAYRRFWMK